MCQLSDGQIEELFKVRVQRRCRSITTKTVVSKTGVDEASVIRQWVDAFKQKREQLAAGRCEWKEKPADLTAIDNRWVWRRFRTTARSSPSNGGPAVPRAEGSCYVAKTCCLALLMGVIVTRGAAQTRGCEVPDGMTERAEAALRSAPARFSGSACAQADQFGEGS